MSSEAEARQKIDKALTTAGWSVQYLDQVNLDAARGVAVREFPLKSGHGDAGLLLHYYDPTAYKNLTDLKPKVSALYESFVEEDIDKKAVAGIRLELAQVYEYVKGKGESNQETTKQIKMIRDLFERHVQDRLKSGKWSEAHLRNSTENIEEAFDIAIQTERLKNKYE